MELHKKFQTLCQKTKNLSFYFAGVLICMNIFAITKTPDFFISKFNAFQSQKIYLFELFFLLGITLELKSKSSKFNKLNHYFYIIIIFNPYINLFQKILTIIILKQLNLKQNKLINLGVKHSIYINFISFIISF